MRTIDIRTTQNVTINYELAGLRDRFLAFLIDLLILVVGSMILSFTSVWVYAASTEAGQIYQLLIVALPVLFYTLYSETLFNGQTVGKMALRIKVVKLDGKQLDFTDYLTRWAFRLVDIWFSLGGLAAMLVTSTDHGQRLGGLLSNSTVVRMSPKLQVSLRDILKINTVDNYEPVYPQIRQFREEDMLMIKQTLERFGRFKNSAHRESIYELSENVARKLDINNVPEDRPLFLKTLIKDYIVLTR